MPDKQIDGAEEGVPDIRDNDRVRGKKKVKPFEQTLDGQGAL